MNQAWSFCSLTRVGTQTIPSSEDCLGMFVADAAKYVPAGEEVGLHLEIFLLLILFAIFHNPHLMYIKLCPNMKLLILDWFSLSGFNLVLVDTFSCLSFKYFYIVFSSFLQTSHSGLQFKQRYNRKKYVFCHMRGDSSNIRAVQEQGNYSCPNNFTIFFLTHTASLSPTRVSFLYSIPLSLTHSLARFPKGSSIYQSTCFHLAFKPFNCYRSNDSKYTSFVSHHR